MDIIEIVTLTLIFVAFVGFSGKRLMTYMHVLQQEEYNNARLFKWMVINRAFDKRLSLILLVLSGIVMAIHAQGYSDIVPVFAVNFLVFGCFIVGTHLEKDPRKNSKKRLVATARAKRIFFPAYILAILCALPLIYLGHIMYAGHFWAWIGVVQLLPFLLFLVNMVLQPFEDAIQAKYWKEAHNIVLDMQPKVIGITGSYGKTSIKHILGHILKTQAPTLITPGSVNTPMGITRVIREELEPRHEYLVVEMGAYGPGSIERLCKLTPPDMGIISTIGHAHYERFKSLDTVAKAKFELAEAVMRKGGKTVIHERTLRFNHVQKMKVQNPESFIVCGDSPDVAAKKNQEGTYITPEDMQIDIIAQKKDGLEVEVTYKGESHSLAVPIYGVHHGYNIALAFAVALELGIDPQDVQDALRSMPQIRHRLEVNKQADGTTLIDDAYNSNPIGFQSALGILGVLGKKGRKILITPGMVELGATHDEIHEKMGAAAAETCDIVIVVNGERIPTFIKGFNDSGVGKNLKEFPSFAEAQSWYIQNKQAGDVVLIENDLPDMYERIPKM